MEAQELIERVHQTIQQRKGENPKVLDVRGISNITDFYVIVSGNSRPHLKALAEETEVDLKHSGSLCYRKSGTPESGWILLDYVDVVVHLMSEEAREYYALEQLWSDAPVIELAI